MTGIYLMLYFLLTELEHLFSVNKCVLKRVHSCLEIQEFYLFYIHSVLCYVGSCIKSEVMVIEGSKTENVFSIKQQQIHMSGNEFIK